MNLRVPDSPPVWEPSDRWTVVNAKELYDIERWGKGYFSVSEEGNILVHPSRDPARFVDLKKLIDTLILRGIDPPILLRFPEILGNQLGELRAVFQSAIAEHNYQGGYRCVYPIKVNQQRQVVEEIYKYGRQYGYGLEAGSKPELLAVAAIADNQTPIICNGFKDDEYIEMCMQARKIGRDITPVIEKYTELDLILKHAASVGVRPSIGIRVKLASRGTGRWKSSGGYRSKFGLTVTEAVRALETLKAAGMEDCLQLLHFHLGSQITNIRHIKAAVIEAARVYVDLKKQGAGLQFLDVGGGLGIDYDGSQTDFESSVNYSLQEYASDIVYHIQNVCDEGEVAHPTIVSESGRAIAAYHSVLVFNVLGVSGFGEEEVPGELPEDAEQPLIDLMETFKGMSLKNLLESFHDAQQALDSALNLFSLGYLPLKQRCLAENFYWLICRRILNTAKQLDVFPEELEGLDAMLSDTYFCNFSLFQSMPDSWAIKQLFPITPIHRLEQPPTRSAVLGDISCDSDGKVDQFIDRRDVKKTLPLHTFNGEPYYLGAFLVGAYQEILGDMHNLLGDTHAVHVRVNEDNKPILEAVIRGNTVKEVLDYVQFSASQLREQFRQDVETAVMDGRIGYEESGRLLKFYEEGLYGYTYLEDTHSSSSGSSGSSGTA
ncbi:MAG: biosynthetic arginine decarboxylase [Candidatus Solibacter usitatus]|nr:biosynthetic arginine decarboxylase [Candidatus Solibacter usitatus]